MIDSKIAVDADRTYRELDELAQFSDVPAPAVTRIVFSSADRAARQYLTNLFEQAELEVRSDPVGNLFARLIGSEPDLPVVGTGSHCDAIPHSGRYDGTVGVLGGLEAIRSLQASGFRPKRSIEVMMFTSEEPTRYGIGCLGSRLMSGKLDPIKAASFKDNAGVTLEQTLVDFGCQGSLDQVRLPSDYYSAFVELHIEQGPLLEQHALPIGVVHAIAAPAALRCSFTGVGGHAGAVLMAGRKDALLGASELALAVERAALEPGNQDTVATTGYCKVHPCAVNSIPSLVELEIDIRDIDGERRNRVLASVQNAAQAIADRRELTLSCELINADPPAKSDAKIVAAIQESCKTLGLPHLDMISRAYHDSLFMAMIAPVAMIFIPCHKGYSHRPDEFSSVDAIGKGVEVLAQSLAKLSMN